MPVVGPLLMNGDNPNSFYSNYHYVTDENGYYKDSRFYYDILYGYIKGLIEVEVIHCTYLVRNEVLDLVSYDDGSGRYEYVIFSDVLRKLRIPQYIDNRRQLWKTYFLRFRKEFNRRISHYNLMFIKGSVINNYVKDKYLIIQVINH